MPAKASAGAIDASPIADIPMLIARLKLANINPSRIASPDLLAQLEQAQSTKIDTLICSILDTDPSVSLNASIAESYPDDLATGVSMLAVLTRPERLWITADPDKSAGWFSDVKPIVDNPALRLVPLRGDYPQTDPTLMLHTLLSRRLPPGRLPTSKGVMLIDAAAAVAVGRCTLPDESARQTPLALRDHFQRRTHLLSVPLDTMLTSVIEFLELHHPDAAYRAGDFLRDLWITPDTPLGNGELIIHATARHLDANPDPCIQCGWCLEACPMRIHPAGLLDAAQQKSPRMARNFGIEACIECGICSYVCPTRLPLLSAIRELRKS